MTEEWRPIPNCPGYEVSDQGRVRSYIKVTNRRGDKIRGFRRAVCEEPQRILKARANRGGYLYVNPMRKGKMWTVMVHALVLAAFVGPCPAGMECCHYDGNKANNRLDNLRWDTPASNARDRTRHGRTRNGAAQARKFTPAQAASIREERANGSTYRELGEKWGASHGPLGKLCRGTTYKECAGPLAGVHR